jgi:hypothetical protein
MQRYAYDHENKGPMIYLKEGEVGKDRAGNDARYWEVENLVEENKRLQGIIAEHDRATFSIQSAPDETRTNQLINELYHERSRLEKQLQHAAELAADAAEAFQDLFNKDYGGVEEPMSEELVAAIIAGSKLGEFSEANGV